MEINIDDIKNIKQFNASQSFKYESTENSLNRFSISYFIMENIRNHQKEVFNKKIKYLNPPSCAPYIVLFGEVEEVKFRIIVDKDITSGTGDMIHLDIYYKEE